MADVRLIVLPYLDVSWSLSFKEFVCDICFNRRFSLWGCFVLLNTFHLCDCWLKLIIWALQHLSVSCLQVRNIETGMKQTTHLLSELVFIHSTRWLNIDLSVWNYIIMSGKSLQTKKHFSCFGNARRDCLEGTPAVSQSVSSSWQGAGGPEHAHQLRAPEWMWRWETGMQSDNDTGDSVSRCVYSLSAPEKQKKKWLQSKQPASSHTSCLPVLSRHHSAHRLSEPVSLEGELTKNFKSLSQH